MDEHVVIYEDWEERDGRIYYKWRVEGEKKWNYKPTALKQKPIIHWKLISKKELDEFYRSQTI